MSHHRPSNQLNIRTLLSPPFRYDGHLSIYGHIHNVFVATSKTVCHNNRAYSFAGDARGWFYSSVVALSEPDTEYRTSHDWRPEFTLSSEASTPLRTVKLISHASSLRSLLYAYLVLAACS